MSGQASMKIDNLSEQALWSPSKAQAEGSQVFRFARAAEKRTGKRFDDYQDLWRWSIDDTETFWDMLWDFCGVIGDKGAVILKDGDKMPGAQFFPQACLNFAENLLRRRDDGVAIIFRDEKETERTLKYSDLYEQVSRWAQALQEAGVKEGDRVA